MQVNGSSTPPTLPFHAARAYGVQPPVQPVRTTPASPVSEAAPVASSRGVERTPAMERLVGGVVPGGVEFDGAQPGVKGAGLLFYTNPADTNAAVTNVNLGRGIDVTV